MGSGARRSAAESSVRRSAVELGVRRSGAEPTPQGLGVVGAPRSGRDHPFPGPMTHPSPPAAAAARASRPRWRLPAPPRRRTGPSSMAAPCPAAVRRALLLREPQPRLFGRDRLGGRPFGRDPFSRDPFGRDPFSRDPLGRDPFSRDPLGRDPLGGGLVGRREPRSGTLGEREQLRRELARVLHDAQPLGPDPVGLGVEVLDPLFAGGRDLRQPLGGRPQAGPRPRAGTGSLSARRSRARVEDPGDLLSDSLERSADSGVGRAGGLDLGHELARLLDVRVDREPVIAAERDREVRISGDLDRVIGQLASGAVISWSSACSSAAEL